jgi:UDP-3-O-[3-hydroxymyristoyl] glucosamine N-acyltransferase
MPAGMSATVGQLAKAIGGSIVPAQGMDDAAAAARVLTGVAGLGDAQEGDLSFLANPKYQAVLPTTKAGCILIAMVQPPLPHAVQVVVSNPDFALAQLVSAFGPQPVPPASGIHPTAVIGVRSVIGARCRIGAYVVVGDDCRIGDDVVLHPHAVLSDQVVVGDGCVLYPQVSVRERCTLGARVILHNGVVVGSDGFGYATVEGVHRKIPQVGTVVIEDDVEIGANCAIDRARFGRTRIGAGCKLDNLVQIAHNVDVGPHSIIVAQAGVAGSTRLGHHVTLAGQVGLAGHLNIGNLVTVTAQSGVGKNLPDGVVVRGSPAQEFKTEMAQEIARRKMPEALERLRRLEARIAALENKAGGA